MQPIGAITPLVIALSVHLLGPKLANSRPSLYGAAIGGGLIVHIVVGFSSGQFSFPYLLLSLLHSAIGFAVLQAFYKFGTGSVRVGCAVSHELCGFQTRAFTYTYANFVLALFAQALVFFFFGGPAESYHLD